MPHISEQKTELRHAILDRLQRMDDRGREAESRSIERRIMEMLPEHDAVCAYVPMKTEPDIRPLLSTVLARNQDLFLPAFDGKTVTMRHVRDLAELHPGTFGILEPSTAAETLDPKRPVTVLIPGRAFDAHGGRLGRGNGGYDRWITDHRAQNDRARYYGVAFDCQIVSEVPMEAHDAFLDGFFSSRGLTPAEK